MNTSHYMCPTISHRHFAEAKGVRFPGLCTICGSSLCLVSRYVYLLYFLNLSCDQAKEMDESLERVTS